MADYIVLRPAPGTPENWLPAREVGRWWQRPISDAVPSQYVRDSFTLTKTRATGYYEYREDGERAEVHEFEAPPHEREHVELLDVTEIVKFELWDSFGADLRRKMATGIEVEAHGRDYRLERPVAYQVRKERVLGTPMVHVRAMAPVRQERLAAEGGEG